jgi:hypothetical protein
MSGIHPEMLPTRRPTLLTKEKASTFLSDKFNEKKNQEPNGALLEE